MSVRPSTTPQWTEAGTPQYRRISVGLFLAGFATFSLIYCVQPLLPEFAADFRISPAASSLALSLTTASLALAIVLAGAGSEALGRRQLMAYSIFAAAALNLIAAALPHWNELLVARALEGFVLGGVPAVAMAYLAEEIHPGGLGLAMGLYVSGTAFGGMMGRVATGALAEFFGWRVALFSLGVIDLVAAIGFILLLPASRNFTPRRGTTLHYHLRAWRAQLGHRGQLALFAVAFAAMGAFVTVYNYVGFRLEAPPYSLTQTEISLIFLVYLFGIVASSAAGILSDRLGRGAVLTAGLLIETAGVLLTVSHAAGLIICGIIVLTIGFFITHSVASSWVGQLAGPFKGHAASLYLLAYYLGSSVMGSAGGHFWSTRGWNGVAAMTVALLAAGSACAVLLWMRQRAALLVPVRVRGEA